MTRFKNRRVAGLLMLIAFIALVAVTSLCSKAVTQSMKDDADIQTKTVAEPDR